MNIFTFKSNVIYSCDTYDIVKCHINELKSKYTIQNWQKNRPPDIVRVAQIQQYLLDNHIEIVDGIICAWLKYKTLYIYDGIHRLEAALNINKDIMLLIKIVKTKDENVVIHDFKQINSSIPIPYLYLENDNKLKVSVFKSIMDMMCRQFPNCISASRNPWKCNFNRDTFIENILCKLDVNFQKQNIDKLIFQVILGINNKAKHYVYKNNIDYFKKCDINNFFIMYFTNDLIIAEIQDSDLLK